MKKKSLLFILLFYYFCSCIFVYDPPPVIMKIRNCSVDTIYVCYAKYGIIDSVRWGLEHQLEFDNTGKIILSDHNDYNIIYPDSIGFYIEGGPKKTFFDNNYNKKGYFFIISLETVKNHNWDEIRENNLYKNMIITKKELEEKNWIINYYKNED